MTQTSFDINKKYHNPGSSVYREYICCQNIDGLDYYTFAYRNKKDDKVRNVVIVHQPHHNMEEYQIPEWKLLLRNQIRELEKTLSQSN